MVTLRPVLVVVVHIDEDDLMSPLLLVVGPGGHARCRGPMHHRGPLSVLVIGADGLDLVQGENGGMLELPLVIRPLPALQGRLLDHH